MQEPGGNGQLSVTSYLTVTFTILWFGGHRTDGSAAVPVIMGGGLEAVVVVVAESLVVLGSRLEALTVAVLLITVPSTTEQFTLATRVMVSVSADASDANVIVRLLPEPPQTPPLWTNRRQWWFQRAGRNGSMTRRSG